MEWFKHFFEKLTASVLRPIGRWILRRSWAGRCVFFLLIAAVVFRWQFPDKAGSVARWTVSQCRAVQILLTRDEAFGLTQKEQQMLAQNVTNVAAALRKHLEIANSGSNPSPGEEAWTRAQVAIAVNGVIDFPRSNVIAFLRQQRDADCHCWRQFPDSGNPFHIPASSWVLISLATISNTSDEKEIDFLLTSQKREGWWAIYPVGDDSINASTYATALAVLSLHVTVDRKLVTNEQSLKRIEQSIANGTDWLLKNRIKDKPRWKFYPHRADSAESIADSALVLHLLRCRGDSAFEDLAHEWISTLPTTLWGPTDFEMPRDTWITLNSGSQRQDITKHFKFPWIAIATADSFSYGTLQEKVAVVPLLRSAIGTVRPSDEELRQKPWAAAEALVALRYLAQMRSF